MTTHPIRTRVVSLGLVRASLLTGSVVWLMMGHAAISIAGAPPPVSLAVETSQASYAPGERIVVTITLTNVSPAETIVSTLGDGNLRVGLLTRDGAKVKPRKTLVLYQTTPRARQIDSLMRLTPGASAIIPFSISLDEFGRNTLIEVRVGKANSALVYPLGDPATYALRFRYRYDGPDGAGGEAMHKAIQSNVVTFRVDP